MKRIAVAALLSMLAVPVQAASLTTTFASNNGQNGNMFDILIGTQSLKITGFDLNINQTSGVDLEWYILEGTYVGSETTASNWTLADSASDMSTNGINNATHWDVDDFVFSADTRYGLYITTTDSTMRYTNGTGVGNIVASDSALTIFEGVGKEYSFLATYDERIWNGTIYYDVLDVAPIPLPAAGWLFLTALGGFGLIGHYGRRKVRPGA